MYFSEKECYEDTYLSLCLGLLGEEEVRHLLSFYRDIEHYECCSGIAKAYKDYRNKNYEFDRGSNPKQTN
tara:strand:- start:16831 stop:17040 length:210 start_codon:yes stop_codon:yes gene_type:complete